MRVIYSFPHDTGKEQETNHWRTSPPAREGTSCSLYHIRSAPSAQPSPWGCCTQTLLGTGGAGWHHAGCWGRIWVWGRRGCGFLLPGQLRGHQQPSGPGGAGAAPPWCCTDSATQII